MPTVKIGDDTITTKTCKCGAEMFFWQGTPWNYKRSPTLQRLEDQPVKNRAFVSHFVTCPYREEFSKKGGGH